MRPSWLKVTNRLINEKIESESHKATGIFQIRSGRNLSAINEPDDAFQLKSGQKIEADMVKKSLQHSSLMQLKKSILQVTLACRVKHIRGGWGSEILKLAHWLVQNGNVMNIIRVAFG